VPDLAESWSWENGGLRLRLRLRAGVATQGGSTLSPETVARELASTVQNKGNQALYWTFPQVRQVSTAGERDVVVDLWRPTGALPEDLDVLLRFDRADDRIGPYRLVSESEREVVVERFSGHYRGSPDIERITFRQYPTVRAAWTSLLRGEVDVVDLVPAEAVQFLGSQHLRITSHLRNYQYLVAFNSAQPIFRLAAVRRALNLAIERQRLVDVVLRGRGQPSTGPLWPHHWAYDTSVVPYRFDPAAAESLLDAAGWPRKGGPRNLRFSFVCLLPEGYRTTERIALEVQRQLYSIGVDMQFRPVPPEEYSGAVLSGRFDAVFGDFVSGPTFGRPYIFWRSGPGPRVYNVFGYQNAEADRLFDVLRSSIDEGTIRSAAGRLQRVFLDDPPALFLVWSERTLAVNRDFVATDDVATLESLWQWKRRDVRQAAAAP
jgi:peptide/nickel transport system substrate-binding protein